MTIRIGGGHCCVCSQVCHHIGGPWYCAEHNRQPPPVLVAPVPYEWPTRRPIPDGYYAAEAKVAYEVAIAAAERRGYDRAVANLRDDATYADWRRQTAPPGHVLTTNTEERRHYARYLTDLEATTETNR